MEVTRDLMDEHELITKYLDLLERYVSVSMKNPKSDLFLAKGADFVDFIKTFADTFHHIKEEKILFCYLGKPGVLPHCNPLPQMLHEHEQGRRFVAGMIDAIEKKNQGSLSANASGYLSVLSDHIYKENNILYPMAEEELSDQAKMEIAKLFKDADESQDRSAFWQKYQDRCGSLNAALNEVAQTGSC